MGRTMRFAGILLVAAAAISAAGCATSDGIGGEGGAGSGGFGALGTGGHGALGGFGASDSGTGGLGSGGSGATGGFGATGGGGGSGGVPPGNGQLGSSCGTCGSGLTCIAPNSGAWNGQGPANGYCTLECTSSTDCAGVDPTAECVSFDGTKGYCLKGCTVGSAFGPGKCHGRTDVGCNIFLRNETTGACGANNTCPSGQLCGSDSQCHPVFNACSPLCAINADCPSGFTCNPGTGLCSAASPTGKDMGQSCTAQTGECKGLCISISGGTNRFCSQTCVVGVPNACGWAGPGTKGDFLCSLIFDAASVAGDVGACGMLCDCNAQCPTGFICQADAAIESNALRKGSCSPGTSGGLTSC